MAGAEAFYLKHRQVDVGKGDGEGGAHRSAFDLEPGAISKGNVVVAQNKVSEGGDEGNKGGRAVCEGKC